MILKVGVFVFSEYSIPDINDIFEENLNESQDQMKALMQLQVFENVIQLCMINISLLSD